MTKSALFKQAHALAKTIIKAGDDYRVTFGLCLKAIIADAKAPKQQITICTFGGNFLVKVPFAIKDRFKKAVKGCRWQPETKEWFVPAKSEAQLRAFAQTL